MSTVHTENKWMLSTVVSALPSWENRVLFIGGATLGFYLEEALHGMLRSTLDVDLVVEVASLSKFNVLAIELRKAGFSEMTERISRWKYKGLLLDILPSNVTELHSSNRWIEEVFARAITQNLELDTQILIPTVFDFILLKFQAFEDRGNDDWLAKDMEDIVTVLDGCPETLLKSKILSPDASEFLISKLQKIITNRDFLNLLPGLLPNSSIIRVQRFKSRVAEFLKLIDSQQHYFNN